MWLAAKKKQNRKQTNKQEYDNGAARNESERENKNIVQIRKLLSEYDETYIYHRCGHGHTNIQMNACLQCNN